MEKTKLGSKWFDETAIHSVIRKYKFYPNIQKTHSSFSSHCLYGLYYIYIYHCPDVWYLYKVDWHWCGCVQVDIKNQGKTALQVAAHQGHVEVVKVLLQANSSIEAKDEDGDAALHYTAFGWALTHYSAFHHVFTSVTILTAFTLSSKSVFCLEVTQTNHKSDVSQLDLSLNSHIGIYATFMSL